MVMEHSTRMASIEDSSYDTKNQSDMTAEQEVQEVSYDFPYHYLDLRADEYRLILHVEYVSRLQTVKDLLKPFEGQRVLDAGCGDGRFCYDMKNENVEIVGVDFSERALTFARAFSPEVEFFAGDLKALEIPGEFDAVVFIETLEHILPREIPTAVESLAGMLKPGGKLIVTVPSINIPLIAKHYQHFTQHSLREALVSHFEVLEILGHNKARNLNLFTRKFFGRFRTLGHWLYPFRRYRMVAKLYELLSDYYNEELAIGPPDDCYGLIAICRKN
jgi:ubiquinone/menaquinone biosynthesis C-methylase UbiE